MIPRRLEHSSPEFSMSTHLQASLTMAKELLTVDG